MKAIIKRLLPKKIAKLVHSKLEMRKWKSRGFLGQAPQVVKENVFLKYGVPCAQWVETGTYLGDTADFLEQNFGKVYSVEPGVNLYEKAHKRFQGRNVELINSVSEEAFPILLPELSGDCNFWLDGHYSAGVTFKGKKDCPIEVELKEIGKNLDNLGKVVILIDDIRCFYSPDSHCDYPTMDFLVDWARKNSFNWFIEQDIFILHKL